MDKHLHIVTHEMPWPVRHGGHIDLYNKIVALHEKGIRIHLHSFSSNEIIPEELATLCDVIKIYPRRKGFNAVSLLLPYIVNSRNCKLLVEELQKDNYPIIFEGTHTTFPLYKNCLKNRKIMIRMHNTEHVYYDNLSKHEANFLRKIYYKAESLLLKRYEQKVLNKGILACVSTTDVTYLDEELKTKALFIPAFPNWHEIKCLEGKGTFCLYHGNLSINENIKAVQWLLHNIFANLEIPLVIAGLHPSDALIEEVHAFNHCCIVANPSNAELEDLIRRAHINLVPSFNETGIKLKLLNSLYNGRFCIANHAGISGSELDCCTIADSVSDFKHAICDLFNKPFTEDMIIDRARMLQRIYNKEKNADKIIALLY